MPGRPRQALIILAASVVVADAGAGGYVLGDSRAATEAEASRASVQARAAAAHLAQSDAYNRARKEGYRAGRRQGRARGRRVGARDGERAGTQVAQSRLAEALAAAEAERLQAVRERAAERARNCGAPLFVEGHCPSDEEVARENKAEELCGPGTEEGRREAARQGIQC
jgi:hypothetical protein